MISEGRKFILDYWWVVTVPGVAIFIVSLGFNLLGDGLRNVLDPKSGVGKSLTRRSILRLVRPPGRADAKLIAFDGEDLLRLFERRMCAVHGEGISV